MLILEKSEDHQSHEDFFICRENPVCQPKWWINWHPLIYPAIDMFGAAPSAWLKIHQNSLFFITWGLFIADVTQTELGDTKHEISARLGWQSFSTLSFWGQETLLLSEKGKLSEEHSETIFTQSNVLCVCVWVCLFVCGFCMCLEWSNTMAICSVKKKKKALELRTLLKQKDKEKRI